MNNHEILVNAQSADRVVKNFSGSLSTFKDNASSTCSELRAAVGAIERGWSGETYDAFRGEMETELAHLDSCLSRVDRLASDLNDISNEFAIMIDLLRKSAE